MTDSQQVSFKRPKNKQNHFDKIVDVVMDY